MSPKAPRCMGAPSFRPEAVMADTALQGQALDALSRNDFYGASRILLGLPERDTYAYHATASVTLAQAQHAVNLGGVNGLHAWYRNEDGSPIDPPPQPDIKAYVSVFSPSTATASALKNLGTNAKKGSIRSQVAHRLNEKRYIHATLASRLMVPKCKSPPSPNPYFDFWVWSCRSPESCGPCPSSERVATSHHGCATPSHESLEVLRTLADGRAVADIGSGNGYWTFMLRCYGLAVHPVDNMQSEWRVNWVGDTIVMDGLKWLRQNDNGKRMVLLLVYPVVGRAQQGTFTRSLVDAFEGDTLAVVGTQNSNGYTHGLSRHDHGPVHGRGAPRVDQGRADPPTELCGQRRGSLCLPESPESLTRRGGASGRRAVQATPRAYRFPSRTARRRLRARPQRGSRPGCIVYERTEAHVIG